MHYRKTTVTIQDSEIGAYQTNGIVAVDGLSCVDEVVDVSPKDHVVNHLIDLLNINQVSAIHFREIIEDFVSVG